MSHYDSARDVAAEGQRARRITTGAKSTLAADLEKDIADRRKNAALKTIGGYIGRLSYEEMLDLAKMFEDEFGVAGADYAMILLKISKRLLNGEDPKAMTRGATGSMEDH